MGRLPNSFLRLLSLIAFVLAAQSIWAQSFPERLYCTLDRYGDTPPLVENKDQFKVAQQVADGIYEFYFDQPDGSYLSFKIYSELLDENPGDGTLMCRNRVSLVSDDGYPGYYLQEVGKTGVMGCNAKLFDIVNDNGNIDNISYYSPKRVRVNLAEGNIMVIPDDTFLMLGVDEPAPDFENLKNYTSVNKGSKYFAPKGGMDFYLYNIGEDVRYGNGGVDIRNGQATLTLSDTQTPFNIPDWDGGIWGFSIFSSKVYVTLTGLAEEGLNYSDCIGLQAVGDFCSWDFNGSVKAEERPEDKVMIIDLPAGSQNFKFSTDQTWSYNLGIDSDYGYRINEDGLVTARLVKSGSDISFLEAPLSDVRCILHIEDEYVTFQLADGSAPAVTIAGEMIDPSYGGPYDPAKEPQNVWLSTPDSDLAEAKFENIGVYNRNNEVFKFDGNAYTLTISLNDSDFDLRIITKLGDTEADTKVICPADDGVLNPDQYVVFRKAKEAAYNDSKGWRLNSDAGRYRNVTITYIPGTDEVTFDFGMPATEKPAPKEIYLVGSPQGWDISSSAMALHYTDKGTYYGEFQVELGSQPIFRFYTELGNWGSDYELPSLGAFGQDGDNREIATSDKCGMVYGKGSWIIPDWNAETMYLEVSLNEMWMRVSDTPIEHGQPAVPQIPTITWYDGYSYSSTSDSKNTGILELGSFYGDEVWFFRSMPKYDVADPRWKQEALTVTLDRTLPESGVSIYNIEQSEGEGNPISTRIKDGYASLRVEGDKLYVVPQNLRYHMIDTDEMPTLSTLEDFEEYAAFSYSLNAPVNLPEGNHTVTMVKMHEPFYPYSRTVDASEGVVNKVDSWNSFDKFDIKNWPGGDLMVSQGLYVINVSKLTDLQIDGYNLNEESGELEYAPQIVKRSENGLFEFDFDIHLRKDGYAINSVGMFIPGADRISIGSIDSYSGISDVRNHQDVGEIYFSGNEAEKPLRFGGRNFSAPELYGGKLHVSLDLKNMKARFVAESENIVNSAAITLAGRNNSVESYNANAPFANHDMRSAYLGTLDAQEYTLTVGMQASQAKRAAFNRAPARTLQFDEYGIAEASYTPGSVNEWNFSLPEQSAVTLCFDNEAGKFRLFANIFSNAYYPCFYGENGFSNSLENLGHDAPNAIVKDKKEGIYKGVLYFPDEDCNMSLTSALGTSAMANPAAQSLIYPLGDNVIDLSDLRSGTSLSFPVAPYVTFYNEFIVKNAPAEGLIAEYDPQEEQLCLKLNDGSLGMDIVTEGVDLRVVRGGVLVSGMPGETVLIYNLQGIKVAAIPCDGETHFIPLAAGLYVSNFGKVIVR